MHTLRMRNQHAAKNQNASFYKYGQVETCQEKRYNQGFCRMGIKLLNLGQCFQKSFTVPAYKHSFWRSGSK